MPNFIRHFYIGLCVALLAAVNLHGVSRSQHDFAHAADWSAVALIEAADDDHPAHVHLPPEEVADLDTDRDGGSVPVGHHHHGGGDVMVAMPASGRVVTEMLAPVSALRRPGPEPALSSLTGDGPEHPPKRRRTVV